MQGSSREHGFFSWNELITSDLESAKKFYGDLFGWKFKEVETIHGNPYLVAMIGDKVVAGMLLRDGNMPEDVALQWDTYVTVDDVDVSVQKVEAAGGKIMLPPMDISGVGRFCVILDPQGVGFNLITYS